MYEPHQFRTKIQLHTQQKSYLSGAEKTNTAKASVFQQWDVNLFPVFNRISGELPTEQLEA